MFSSFTSFLMVHSIPNRFDVLVRLNSSAAMLTLADYVRLGTPGVSAATRTLLEASRAPSTLTAYVGTFEKYRKFVLSKNGLVLPVRVPLLLDYLQLFVSKGSTAGTVKSQVFAINYISKIAGYGPVSSFALTTYLEGAARLCAPANAQKRHFEKSHVFSVMAFLMPDSPFKLIRDVAMFVVAFFGFLRASELLALKCSDIAFTSDSMTLFVRKSKTDQMALGSTIAVARQDVRSSCPVALAERYVAERQVFVDHNRGFADAECLFFSLSGPSRPCSYDLFLRCVKSFVLRLGLCPDSYGTHSLRSGGTTAAVSHGVDPRLIQSHGRWKCAKSMDIYDRSLRCMDF